MARRRRPLDPLRAPRGPFPGRADAFWLAGYPRACAGLALLLRARVRGSLGPTMWLDGAIAAAAVASLVAAAAPGRGAGALAYPLGDVLLLCLAAGATALLGRRAGRTFGLVAAGLALCAVADAARLLEGVEVRAPLAALVLACAAALPAETRRRSRARRRRPCRPARRIHARRARRAAVGPPGRRAQRPGDRPRPGGPVPARAAARAQPARERPGCSSARATRR